MMRVFVCIDNPAKTVRNKVDTLPAGNARGATAPTVLYCS